MQVLSKYDSNHPNDRRLFFENNYLTKKVEKAYEYMVEYKDSLFQKIHFDIKYSSKSKQSRGIYLKECDELTETRDYLVTVEPKFFENKLKTALSKEKQLNLNDKDLLEGNWSKFEIMCKIKFSTTYSESMLGSLNKQHYKHLIWHNFGEYNWLFTEK